MPTYAELLDSEEWRAKRKQILLRDKFLCQNCKNVKIIRDCKEGVANNSPCDSEINIEGLTLTSTLTLTLEEFKKKNGISSIPVMRGTGRMFAEVIINGKVEKLFFTKQTDLKKPLFVSKGTHDALWVSNNDFISKGFVSDEVKSILPEKMKAFYYIDEDKKVHIVAYKNFEGQYVYVPSLHVHHKYYQKGLKPWEYPDRALISYCWVCHKELHGPKAARVIEKSKFLKSITFILVVKPLQIITKKYFK